MPSQTVRVRDSLVRSVVTPELLQTHLNLYYVNDEVAAILNPALTSCLGIETLTSEHLFQLGKALIVAMGPKCSKLNLYYIFTFSFSSFYCVIFLCNYCYGVIYKVNSYVVIELGCINNTKID